MCVRVCVLIICTWNVCVENVFEMCAFKLYLKWVCKNCTWNVCACVFKLICDLRQKFEKRITISNREKKQKNTAGSPVSTIVFNKPTTWERCGDPKGNSANKLEMTSMARAYLFWGRNFWVEMCMFDNCTWNLCRLKLLYSKFVSIETRYLNLSIETVPEMRVVDWFLKLYLKLNT